MILDDTHLILFLLDLDEVPHYSQLLSNQKSVNKSDSLNPKVWQSHLHSHCINISHFFETLNLLHLSYGPLKTRLDFHFTSYWFQIAGYVGSLPPLGIVCRLWFRGSSLGYPHNEEPVNRFRLGPPKSESYHLGQRWQELHSWWLVLGDRWEQIRSEKTDDAQCVRLMVDWSLAPRLLRSHVRDGFNRAADVCLTGRDDCGGRNSYTCGRMR